MIIKDLIILRMNFVPRSTQRSEARLFRNLTSHLYLSLQNVLLIAFSCSIHFILSFGL